MSHQNETHTTAATPSTGTAAPKLTYTAAEVQAILGNCNRCTLWKLGVLGHLRPLPGFNRNRLYSVKAVEKYLAGESAATTKRRTRRWAKRPSATGGAA